MPRAVEVPNIRIPSKLSRKQRDNLNSWITALRSGAYMQGHQKLHNTTNNTFCCLGVACDLHSVMVHKRMPTYTVYESPVQPGAVWSAFVDGQWLTQKFGIDVPVIVLAQYNDAGHSFDEISVLLANALLEHDKKFGVMPCQDDKQPLHLTHSY